MIDMSRKNKKQKKTMGPDGKSFDTFETQRVQC